MNTGVRWDSKKIKKDKPEKKEISAKKEKNSPKKDKVVYKDDSNTSDEQPSLKKKFHINDKNKKLKIVKATEVLMDENGRELSA